MRDEYEYLVSRRFWSIMLLMPFAAIFLAMSAFAVVHEYLGAAEVHATDSLGRIGATAIEALIWMAVTLAPQYVILFRVYALDIRSAFRAHATIALHSIGGIPTMIASVAGLVLALTLGRTLFGNDVFKDAVSDVFAVLAIVQGLLIATLADLGETKLRAADDQNGADVP